MIKKKGIVIIFLLFALVLLFNDAECDWTELEKHLTDLERRVSVLNSLENRVKKI
jgi:hypothetical protein